MIIVIKAIILMAILSFIIGVAGLVMAEQSKTMKQYLIRTRIATTAQNFLAVSLYLLPIAVIIALYK